MANLGWTDIEIHRRPDDGEFGLRRIGSARGPRQPLPPDQGIPARRHPRRRIPAGGPISRSSAACCSSDRPRAPYARPSRLLRAGEDQAPASRPAAGVFGAQDLELEWRRGSAPRGRYQVGARALGGYCWITLDWPYGEVTTPRAYLLRPRAMRPGGSCSPPRLGDQVLGLFCLDPLFQIPRSV